MNSYICKIIDNPWISLQNSYTIVYMSNCLLGKEKNLALNVTLKFLYDCFTTQNTCATSIQCASAPLQFTQSPFINPVCFRTPPDHPVPSSNIVS